MKEFKHTPGTWRVNGKYIDSTQSDGMVQEVAWLGDVGYGDRMANASLIAAAPDLLEALQIAENAMSAGRNVTYPELYGAINKARAAISKALGEE